LKPPLSLKSTQASCEFNDLTEIFGDNFQTSLHDIFAPKNRMFMLGKELANFPTQTSEKWQQLIFRTQKTSVRFPNSNPNINNFSLETGVVQFVKDHHN